MPHKGEITHSKDRRVSSVEAARSIVAGLALAVISMKEAGMDGYTKQGKTRYKGQEHIPNSVTMDEKEYMRQHRIRDSVGYVAGFEIRENDQNKITYARINRALPARFVDLDDEGLYIPYKADYEYARMQITHHDGGIGPRVAIDGWRLPFTRLTEHLLDGGDIKTFEDMRENFFRRADSVSIPVAAIDVEHWVLGRPDEVVLPREQDRIVNLMAGFRVAVQSEIDYHHELTAARRA
jgi:hypothetical protein